jgi:hypothetical protein
MGGLGSRLAECACAAAIRERRYLTVDHLARLSRHATFCLLTTAALLAAGCGEQAATVPVHDRVWLTAVPRKMTDEVAAFVIVRASESKQYGFLFKGSLLRGSYDTFHWAPDGEDRAKLRTIQDDKVHKIRTESCAADEGFDYCVQIHGDPQGTVRYQSRKRWGLGRPKAKLLGFDLASELQALAAVDGELAAALAELEAAATP